MKELFNGVSQIDMRHYSPCNTLAWGKINGVFAYIRRIDSIMLYRNAIEESTVTMQEFARKVFTEDLASNPLMYVVYSGPSDFIVMVMEANEVMKFKSDCDVYALCPDGYTPCGYGRFKDFSGDFDYVYRARLYSFLYVPFNDGPNGSKIPVSWYRAEVGSLVNSFDRLSCMDMCVPKWSKKEISNFYLGLKEKYPSVDLENVPSSRYATVTSVEDDIIYNRNHIAYNGTISNAHAVMSMVLRAFTYVSDFNYDSRKICRAVIDFINGKEVDVEDVIDEVMSVDTVEPKSEVAESTSSGEPTKTGDPLLDAALSGFNS